MLQSTISLNVLTESVTAEVTPLSQYGHDADIVKITANIKLVQPLAEETKFILPEADGIKIPKIYLADGTSIVEDFDPTSAGDINQIPERIKVAVDEYINETTIEKMNKVTELMATYQGYKSSKSSITIPANANYITFSYSKYIERDATGVNKFEINIPFNGFSLQQQQGSKADIIVLMPYELGSDVNKVIESKWNIPNNGQMQELQRGLQAGRIVLSQYWQYDPVIKVSYKY